MCARTYLYACVYVYDTYVRTYIYTADLFQTRFKISFPRDDRRTNERALHAIANVWQLPFIYQSDLRPSICHCQDRDNLKTILAFLSLHLLFFFFLIFLFFARSLVCSFVCFFSLPPLSFIFFYFFVFIFPFKGHHPSIPPPTGFNIVLPNVHS